MASDISPAYLPNVPSSAGNEKDFQMETDQPMPPNHSPLTRTNCLPDFRPEKELMMRINEYQNGDCQSNCDQKMITSIVKQKANLGDKTRF